MAAYAGFFYVYCTALVLIEGLVGIAFAVRSFAESSRKMAILAIAYAWSAPLAVIDLIALPGIPPDLPGEPLQVAPAIWLLWHLGWPLLILSYARVPSGPGGPIGWWVPVAFAGAIGACLIIVANGAHLPALVGTHEHIERAFRAGIALTLLVDLAVAVDVARRQTTARDRWVAAALGFATLEATLMLVTDTRFTLPYFLSRIAGVASAAAMLAAVVVDGFAVVRRAAEQSAERDRLAEVRAIADTMPQIVWQLAADGRNVYANARWSEYTGRPRRDGSDQDFLEAIHPDDRPNRNDAYARALASGSQYEATYRLRRADGEYRNFLTRAVPIVRDGVVTGWVGTSTDIEDRTQLELRQISAYARDAGRMRTLASIGRALSQSLDLDVVLTTAVRAMVPHVADWALINLREETGELVVAAAHHRDPERLRRIRTLVGHSYVIPNARGGSVEVVANVSNGLRIATLTEDLLRRTVDPAWIDLMLELEPRSCVVVPLATGDIVRGTLNVNFAESGREYGPDDLEMLEEVGRRIALAIENAEFYAREHRVADRLQRASLPSSLPRIPGVELDAVYQAGRSEAQIGGDWYDAFELDDGRLIVSVGDVMGSGLEAAATMGAVRQAMRGAAEVLPDPVTILDAADRTLRKTQPDGLVTAFLAILEPVSGTITFASAGHPPPFVRRPDGSIDRLESRGLPIGLRAEAPRASAASAVLEDGALLVLYTDGLTEVERDIAAGEERLAAALATVGTSERPSEALRRGVLGDAESVEPRDDIAILTIRLTPARRRRVTDLRCDVRDPAAVRRVRSAVVAALQHSGFSEEAVFDAELVLGELLGNVVRHAPPIADVRLDLRGESPLLSVLDRGPGCPGLPSLPDNVAEGGRGLFLASRLVAELAVETRTGGGTEIRVTLRVD